MSKCSPRRLFFAFGGRCRVQEAGGCRWTTPLRSWRWKASLAIPESDLPSEGRQAFPKGRNAKPHGTGLRVLLVEDDKDSAECTSLLLQIEGHQVQVARNGQAALQMAQADPPDVVLLEIHLPGMNGWEVAKALQQQATEKKPICIAFTTCGTEADQRHSKEAGIDLHLAKPLEPGYLRAVLRRFQEIIRSDEAAQETTKGPFGL
jgi:CheY-like chemotaxis protein